MTRIPATIGTGFLGAGDIKARLLEAVECRHWQPCRNSILEELRQ